MLDSLAMHSRIALVVVVPLVAGAIFGVPFFLQWADWQFSCGVLFGIGVYQGCHRYLTGSWIDFETPKARDVIRPAEPLSPQSRPQSGSRGLRAGSR